MLVLSRKINQSIMIGNEIRITVVGVDRDQVKLGIEAPRQMPVHRAEVFGEIQRNGVSTVVANAPERVGKAAVDSDITRDVDLA